ncbi:MAG: 3-isopropylmalate dehydratase [Spirochaetia bacterium]
MKKNEVFSGRVILLPDDVDTDIIIPTQYMTLSAIKEMCRYAFSPLRPELAANICRGDILVAGKNFGCGSSREQAPEIIRELGIACVIAESFARIFYRNALTNGLLVIEAAGLAEHVKEGESLTVDMKENLLITTGGKRLGFAQIPSRLIEMIEAGGLVEYYKELNGVKP